MDTVQMQRCRGGRNMTEYEKQLVEELDQDYRELVDGMSDLLALDTANLILHYGTDGKKVLDDIIRLIAVASQALRVPMGKVMAKTGMLEESVAEFEPGSDVLYINADYVNGREDLESAGKLLTAVHTAVFLRYVKTVAESEHTAVNEYAEKNGWDKEWKHPVDKRENPRLYFEQKYMRAASGYGIAVREASLQKARRGFREMENKKGGNR